MKMVADIRDKIAWISQKAITKQLSLRAYEQLVENFCLPRCGHTPDGQICALANAKHQALVALLFKEYSGLN